VPQPEKITVGDETLDVKDTLQPWLDRLEESEKHRGEFIPQVQINRKFAAGKQHVDIQPRDGRVLEIRYRTIGGVKTKMQTSDRLAQYIQAAVGRLGSNDYRPNFLSATMDENANQITQMLNDAFGWGWDNEWDGDRKKLALLRLLAIDGTAAIRCRYDRKYGEVLGDIPYKDGRPLTGEEGRKYVAEAQAKGDRVAFGTLREGKVCWEVLSIENILWPVGLDDPLDWPWEIVGKAIDLREIHKRYGKMADGVEEEPLESAGSLTSGLGFSGEQKTRMKGKAMVFTAYEKPTSKYKKGRTIVFTRTNLLDVIPSLPYSDHPKGPRSGVHYFRWQIIPGRFPGRAFIEGGIGPQIILNKRVTQIDTIIDRNMPKTYIEEQSIARPKTGEPMEIIEVRPGSPLPQTVAGLQPGNWMNDDIKLQESSIESALGMKSITLGQPPQGVSAYSAMALLSENDALKLDPIAQDIRLGFTELAWDTMESMRNWPKKKIMDIAGPDGALRSFIFSSNEIPERYVVDVPNQGALPRSQAAELQKINDIWNAAASVGQPLPLDWYVTSLNAGKAQDLPASLTNVSKHKAELENIVMFHSKQSVPVSPEDDDLAHVEIHRSFQMQQRAIADQGDAEAEAIWQALEQHCQEHLASAQNQQQPNPGEPTGGMETTNSGVGQQPGSMGPTPGTLGAGTSPEGTAANAGVATPPWLFRPVPKTGL